MNHKSSYFSGISNALEKAGIYQPSLVLDLDSLDHNIDVLLNDLPDGMAYRIVAKSLPVPDLLSYVSKHTQTHKYMTFNIPMLVDIAKRMPKAHQLLGKPLSVTAFEQVLKQLSKSELARITWLIDSPQRLASYYSAIKKQQNEINIAVELDVGLHRGGMEPGQDLELTLKQIHHNSLMTFDGFMGYEPHLASVPTVLGWQERKKQRAWQMYQQAVAQAKQIFGADHVSNCMRNAAGSPTYRLYQDTQIANEVAVGSALVKPTDFDTQLLSNYTPACFIVTPVLKALGRTKTPVLEIFDNVKNCLLPKSAQTFFIHGGKWMASPCYPEGLRYNKVVGRSSNQEMLNGPISLKLQENDYVFLRPHQSEAIFFQFGDLVVVRSGEVVDRWPTFPISA